MNLECESRERRTIGHEYTSSGSAVGCCRPLRKPQARRRVRIPGFGGRGRDDEAGAGVGRAGAEAPDAVGEAQADRTG